MSDLKPEYVMPRIIAVSPEFHAKGPEMQRQLRKEVALAMSPATGSVLSRSGMTAALAIMWCEERGLPYTVMATPGKGYTVSRLTEVSDEQLRAWSHGE